jgi:nitroreductase
MPNPVIDCLMSHRSIRKFKPQALDAETLETLLQAGIRAASAGNLQHYSLIVVDDPEKKKALLDWPEAGPVTYIIAAVDEYRFKRWAALSAAPFYFDQVVNLFIGYWDAIVALHNIQVAAESLGLGTVYIGTVLSSDIHAILGTPEYVFPAGMLVVGYPDETPELRPRLPLEAVVHYNGYHIPTDDEVNAFFLERNRLWNNLSASRREELTRQGITNMAQRTTLGHYTEEFISGESKAIFENLKKAGFKIGEPAA